jgi:hypothetical protein
MLKTICEVCEYRLKELSDSVMSSNKTAPTLVQGNSVNFNKIALLKSTVQRMTSNTTRELKKLKLLEYYFM